VQKYEKGTSIGAALACYQCALIAPETGIRTSPLFQKGVAIWSQRNVSGVGMSRRISTCMTAPTISRRRTWLARNDSSVSCVGTSRSLAAMALRVSLSRSTKWRRDDEPLEPQARRAFRSSRRPGLSIESIMAMTSRALGASAASRWGRALEVGSPFTIPLPAEDRYVLEFAADAHGVSTAGLALAIVQCSRKGYSLLDDREAVASDDVRPMRRRRRRGARTALASIAATSFSMARADGA
jgi:hypothetical protein